MEINAKFLPSPFTSWPPKYLYFGLLWKSLPTTGVMHKCSKTYLVSISNGYSILWVISRYSTIQADLSTVNKTPFILLKDCVTFKYCGVICRHEHYWKYLHKWPLCEVCSLKCQCSQHFLSFLFNTKKMLLLISILGMMGGERHFIVITISSCRREGQG